MVIKSSNVEVQRLVREILVLLLLLIFLIVIGAKAWMSDDAYITLRTIDNFINGYGLTWNISERVQVYTHPLWMMLISIFYFFSREAYFTTLSISLIISLAAVILFTYMLVRIRILSILGIMVLILSRAYTDYSTSGLENPLSHLLLVIFFILYINPGEKINKPFVLSLIASLGSLNRLDILIIYLPTLVVVFWNSRGWKTFWYMLAGQIPLLFWFGFSLLYYGFLFPNPAYAKLNTGIPSSELISQGYLYFLDSFSIDPITIVVIIFGMISPLVMKEKGFYPLSAGILLYLIYVIRIGGDFMSGRFFSVPLLASLISIAGSFSNTPQRKLLIPAFFLILILGFLSPKPTYRIFGGESLILDSGITDERGFYYPYTGILSLNGNSSLPNHPWAEEGKSSQGRNEPILRHTIGFFGYFAGPEVHIIDRNALADPLLARLHIDLNNPWRIGHFNRPIPPGYFESVMTGNNVIKDPDIKRLYNEVKILTRGDIFDPQRLKTIWKFNSGQYSSAAYSKKPSVENGGSG